MEKIYRIRLPEDLIPGREAMSPDERARWARDWKDLVQKRPRYRWSFAVSFVALLAFFGGVVAPAVLAFSHGLRARLSMPFLVVLLSAMLAYVLQFLLSRGEMKRRIERAHRREEERIHPANGR
ncbi:MAG: hypothetical protein ABIZ04_24845 [Opitutus sp.]